MLGRKPSPESTLSSTTSTLLPLFDRLFNNIETPFSDCQDAFHVCYQYLINRPFMDLYEAIDEYFMNKAREIASSVIIQDDKFETMKSLLREFEHYRSISKFISWILSYMNGPGLKRYIRDEALKIPEKKMSNLKLEESKATRVRQDFTSLEGEGVRTSDVVACTQASMPVQCVIPSLPLALRRFRTEVVEPLILSSSEMEEWVKLNLLSATSDNDERRIAEEFKAMLCRVGFYTSYVQQ